MVLESVDLGDLWYSVFLDLGDLLWAVCRSASFSCVSSREVYQVWQEWMLGVCLVNWTKGPIVFVDSCTCDRHAGTVHPAKDTWDLDGRFCFEVM